MKTFLCLSIQTDLRNISEFKLIENSSGDTLRIYSVHPKANNDEASSLQRKAEIGNDVFEIIIVIRALLI